VFAFCAVAAPGWAELTPDAAAADAAVETPDEAWIAARPKPKLSIESSLSGGKWRKRRAIDVDSGAEVTLQLNAPVGGAEAPVLRALVRWSGEGRIGCQFIFDEQDGPG